MTILLFFVILLLLVIVHECGHFIVAKSLGVRVDEFGVGYPPRALSFGVWGGTEYTLNWLPFGGFVKIYGEDGEGATSSEKRVSLAYKPWYAQILVLAAGVVANVLLAWVLFVYATMYGAPITVPETSSVAAHAHVVVTSVLQNSPADIAGISVNDRIVGLRSKKDTLAPVTPSSVTTFIQSHPGEALVATIERTVGGVPQTVDVSVTPMQGVRDDRTIPAIGIAMGFLMRDTVSLHDAVIIATLETGKWLTMTGEGVAGMLKGVVTRTGSLSDVSGPVGIAQQVGSWYGLGSAYLAYFVAILSVNLAIINLIPIPALDGGRIVFVLIERVIRRRIPSGVAGFVNTVGFALLMILMLVVTWSDVWKLL